ncbi:MAG TPA: VOC family protein [Myxococcaceae bacterium]|nr:VOC family protein [Myxococcaceae bacterium]
MATLPETLPSFTKLLIRDQRRAAALYTALGFETLFRDEVFLHLRFAPGAELYLVTAPPNAPLPEPRGAGVLVCFAVGAGVSLDALAEQAREVGAPVQGPSDQPWNTRELIVTDPEGYRINFVQPLGAGPG